MRMVFNSLKTIKVKIYVLLQVVCIFSFLLFLKDTDSLYSVYVFCGLIGMFALFYNTIYISNGIEKRKVIIYLIASFVFSLCILLANYQLFQFFGFIAIVNSCLKVTLIGLGSISVSWNTLIVLDYFCGKEFPLKGKKHCKLSLTKVAAITFGLIVAINVIYLFFCNYPGNLSPDSIVQVKQILNNQYSNHHPFYHTMIIKGCLSIGMLIFGEINAAVACYSVFQIFFMASCFTYCVVTLYQMKVPSKWIVLTILFFSLMPYHIAYSITMWKDVPFGGAILLLITSLYRIIKNIGKRRWSNWLLLVVGSFGTCLWRGNGLIVFAVTVLIFTICYFKKCKKLNIVLASVLMISYFLLNPFLSIISVNKTEFTESLSIPLQQVSRVIVEDGNISDAEMELLNKIIDTNRIPQEYKEYISDPIKNLVTEKDAHVDYLRSNSLQYLALWVSVGLKNPGIYIKAWVDQTKGYWNGGYNYWIWIDGITNNSMGIQRDQVSGPLSCLHDVYYGAFYAFFNTIRDSHGEIVCIRNNYDMDELLGIFRSIGLCTWIIAACGCISLANKRGKQAILVVPLLAIILTLSIATPVYSEFRYAYALFTCVPLIICTTFYKGKEV